MPHPVTGAADFEALYRRDSDPFRVATSWYERRKEQILLAGLTRARYRLAWDCATGTGQLAHRLAACCDDVLATDASPTAVELASALTAGQPRVRCGVSALPEIPAECQAADLTIVAEVLYYLPQRARAAAIGALVDQSGELVSVHWRHHPHDGHVSGTEVTDELGVALVEHGWGAALRHDDVDFVLAAWTREAQA
ncbi:MAG: class I SAM-dependent methyltransferase [Marmoricola sp.]